MLGVQAAHRGHLRLQELAADGKGFRRSFAALLEAQTNGFDGLAEVRCHFEGSGRPAAGKGGGGAAVKLRQGLSSQSLGGPELGLSVRADGQSFPRAGQANRHAKAGDVFPAFLDVTAPEAPATESHGLFQVEALLLRFGLGQERLSQRAFRQKTFQVGGNYLGDGTRVRQGSWRAGNIRKGDQLAQARASWVRASSRSCWIFNHSPSTRETWKAGSAPASNRVRAALSQRSTVSRSASRSATSLAASQASR